jgi:hypothetical protein
VPLTTIELAPGVNKMITPTQGMAQIIDASLIRFIYAGNKVLPQKLGGWSRFFPVSLGSPPRAMHAWEGLNADTYLSVGCELSLNVITEGVSDNVTPRTFTSDSTPSFTTVMGSTLVTIDDPNITTSSFDSIYILTPIAVGGIVLQGAYAIETTLDSDSYTILAAVDALSSEVAAGVVPEFSTVEDSPFINVDLENHGYSLGQAFAVPTPTTVGGIVISGAYLVQAVTDADNFTIIASTTAASTDSGFMNGGDASIVYFIGGAPSAAAGYGVGGYGEGGYGIGIAPTADSGDPITATNWTLDNWGSVLIATAANGPIYTWSPDSGFPVAVKIVDAPLVNGGAFIAQPAQILVAWASSQNGVQDPLSINWSDAGDYTNWTVSSQTQAGGYRLPTGSKIVGGLAGPNFSIIWTDLECWSMDYIEPPFVFGFNAIGQNCGLISRHGYAVLNSVVYWFSNNKFCRLVGETVQTIPCSVWDFVFQDLDTTPAALDKITVGSNSLFGEIWFFFPSASGGTGEIDSYVKFNPDLNVWDSGRLGRSAWIDQSPAGEPMGASPGGIVFQHEVSPDADGQPMLPRFRTGFFEIAEGEQLTFIDWMFPDFTYGYESSTPSAILQITVYFQDYPNSAIKSVGPFSVSAATEYVNLRLRGRMVSLEISSSDLGSFWRLGALKFRSTADGTR